VCIVRILNVLYKSSQVWVSWAGRFRTTKGVGVLVTGDFDSEYKFGAASEMAGGFSIDHFGHL